MGVENSILRQKARVQWVVEGDENTTFFHVYIKQRQANTRITRLVLEDGKEVMDCDGIEVEILRFCKGLLGSSSRIQGVIKLVVRNKSLVSSDAAVELLVPITLDEIIESLKHIHSSKAPGYDGWNAYFISKCGLLSRLIFNKLLLPSLNYVCSIKL